MNQQQGEPLAKVQTTKEQDNQKAQSQPRYLLMSWILLLLLGVLFVLASIFDLLADISTGLPSDHLEAFHELTGLTWSNAQQSAHQIAHYVTILEITYAVHEMVFALLFLLIILFPFRQRARWSWWACWVPMLANLTYTFALARYSTTTLIYSLIADIALPILLLIHMPSFFRKQKAYEKA